MRSQFRVVKCKDAQLPYLVQFSCDRLAWVTLNEFGTFEEAKEHAEAMTAKFCIFEPMREITHILWKSK